MSLLSASELGMIQSLAQSGMSSVATIERRTTIQTADGQESTYAPIGTTICWVKQITGDASMLGNISGAVGISQLVNIRVPIGTDVLSGDHLILPGGSYTVEAGNQDDSYPAWVELACRTIE